MLFKTFLLYCVLNTLWFCFFIWWLLKLFRFLSCAFLDCDLGVILLFACFGADTGLYLDPPLLDLRSLVDFLDLSRDGYWHLWYVGYFVPKSFLQPSFRDFSCKSCLRWASWFSKLTQFLRSLWPPMELPALLFLLNMLWLLLLARPSGRFWLLPLLWLMWLMFEKLRSVLCLSWECCSKPARFLWSG